MVRILWKFVVIGLLLGVIWFLMLMCALKDKKTSEINEVDKTEVIVTYILETVLFIGPAVCMGAVLAYVSYNKKFVNIDLNDLRKQFYLLLTIILNMFLIVAATRSTCGLLIEEIRLKKLGCIHTERICKKMIALSEKLMFFLIGFAIFDILRSLYDIDKNKETIYSVNLTLLCLTISEFWSCFSSKKKKSLQMLEKVKSDLICIIGGLIFLILGLLILLPGI